MKKQSNVGQWVIGLTIVLIILRLTKTIHWAWWIIFLPLMVCFAFAIVMLTIIGYIVWDKYSRLK